MNKPVFFSWLRRQPRRIIQSKPVAYIMGELPPYDAKLLFCSSSEYPLLTDWRYNVHMTAKNALIGKTHFRQLQDFINRNPQHKFYFWDDKYIIKFIDEYFNNSPIGKVFKSIPYGIVRADIFRLCVLLVHGGIYLDLKSQFLSSLSLLDYATATGYLVEEPHLIQDKKVVQELRLPTANQLTNWAFAFAPNHFFLKAAIDEIVEQYESGKSLLNGQDFRVAVWEFSGPRMITRVANRLWSENIDVEIIPHDCKLRQPLYACRGSWVRTLIHQHYTNPLYPLKNK